jgi:hypothetical protein
MTASRGCAHNGTATGDSWLNPGVLPPAAVPMWLGCRYLWPSRSPSRRRAASLPTSRLRTCPPRSTTSTTSASTHRTRKTRMPATTIRAFRRMTAESQSQVATPRQAIPSPRRPGGPRTKSSESTGHRLSSSSSLLRQRPGTARRTLRRITGHRSSTGRSSRVMAG